MSCATRHRRSSATWRGSPDAGCGLRPAASVTKRAGDGGPTGWELRPKAPNFGAFVGSASRCGQAAHGIRATQARDTGYTPTGCGLHLTGIELRESRDVGYANHGIRTTVARRRTLNERIDSNI